MKVSFTHATYVPALNEGISKNVHYLKSALTEVGVTGDLRTPSVRIEDLNRKSNYVTKGLEAARHLRGALKDPEIDVVHYHVAIPLMGVWAQVARAGLSARKPLVGHLWNPCFVRGDTAHPPRGVELAYHLAFNSTATLRAGITGFDALIVSSRYQERQIRSAGFKGPVYLIPNGVALDEYRPPADDAERLAARRELGIPEGKKIVAYFGHLTPWKGVATLVAAAPEVARENPDARFVIAHTRYGAEGEALRAEVRRHGLEDRFTFLGDLHVPTFLRTVDVGVVPTLSPVGTACFPNVLLEFLSAGVPIVTTRVGSIPEVVEDGHEGRLVPPGDAEAMAGAITGLLQDEVGRREMARRARVAAVSRFGWLGIAKEVRAAYEDLLDLRSA